MCRVFCLICLCLLCAQSYELRAGTVDSRHPGNERKVTVHEGQTESRPAESTIKASAPVPEALRLQTYLSARKKKRSRSVGAPNKGRLRHGVMLGESGLGWIRRDRDAAYGTDDTISLIHYVGARLFTAFPGTAPLVIGNISKKGGGRLPPHRSHRTGRDVDIGFPEKGNLKRRYFNGDIRISDIDYRKAWFVLETLILTRTVQYIFVNGAILPHLLTAARQAGWASTELERLIMGAGDTQRRGIIRSAEGHRAHFHIRFICPLGNSDCDP